MVNGADAALNIFGKKFYEYFLIYYSRVSYGYFLDLDIWLCEALYIFILIIDVAWQRFKISSARV